MQGPDPIGQQLTIKHEIDLDGNIQDGRRSTGMKTEPFNHEVNECHKTVNQLKYKTIVAIISSIFFLLSIDTATG